MKAAGPLRAESVIIAAYQMKETLRAFGLPYQLWLVAGVLVNANWTRMRLSSERQTDLMDHCTSHRLDEGSLMVLEPNSHCW
jgi:hypothetical protein